MDFTLPPDLEELRQRVRRFVAEEVLPLEADRSVYDDYENIRLDVLDALRAKARAGLWAPQMPKRGAASACRSRLGGVLRGSQPLDLRPAVLQLPGTR